MTVFDASALFGAVDRYEPVRSQSRQALIAASLPASTTEACVTEAMHLAGSRIGWHAQSELWLILRRLAILPCDANLAERLMRKYRDVPMDFADATLVALASEEPRVRVATFDSDFLAYRRQDGSPVPLVGDRLLGWV